jgi:hypothetical protein
VFRYRLHSAEGDDLGEATYAMTIGLDELIHFDGTRTFRVLDVVAFEEKDEDGFVGMLKVEAA